jgi:hypothetical protein
MGGLVVWVGLLMGMGSFMEWVGLLMGGWVQGGCIGFVY